ncbi:heme-binding protein [soil metagenome]
MKTKPCLDRDDVAKILAAAEAEAKKNGFAVTIAVVDDGAHLLGMIRLDGAPPVSAFIGVEKARTAALGCRESKDYETMVKDSRPGFLSVTVLQGMLEGGAPIVVDGRVVGAVGVSGVKAPEDASVAKAGIAALSA